MDEILDLKFSKSCESIKFVDAVKHSHNCTVSTCHRHYKNHKFHCFWCRLSYNQEPLHCPIKFHPKQIIKKFENTHILKGNVEDSVVVNDTQDYDVGYFEVDGSFCSWSCVISFIRDNKHNPLFSQSEQLVYKMRGKYTSIVPAPHWRMLDMYGGSLSPLEMRKKIGTDNYQEFHYIIFINHIYEKKIC